MVRTLKDTLQPAGKCLQALPDELVFNLKVGACRDCAHFLGPDLRAECVPLLGPAVPSQPLFVGALLVPLSLPAS